MTSPTMVPRRDPRGALTCEVAVAKPGILRWTSFRDRLRVADAHGVFVAALALTLRGLSPRDRRAFLAFAVVPLVLSALSDTRPRRPS